MITSQCLRCAGEFTEPQPRAFCPSCRPIAAAEMNEAPFKFYLHNPDVPMPGDTVRRRTPEDKAFERSVMTDLDNL